MDGRRTRMARWGGAALVVAVALGAGAAAASPRGYDLNVLLHDPLPEWWMHPDAPAMRARSAPQRPDERSAVSPLEPIPNLPSSAGLPAGGASDGWSRGWTGDDVEVRPLPPIAAPTGEAAEPGPARRPEVERDPGEGGLTTLRAGSSPRSRVPSAWGGR
jgi:hypothetical protein